MKAIVPKRQLPGKRETNAAIRRAMERAGGAGEVMVGRTIATWQTRTTVKAEIKGRGGDYTLRLNISPDQQAKIWGWLDQGTDVRYAIMSPDWVSKTVPGNLDSRSGSGHVIIVDTSNPQPGIQARGWSEDIAKKLAKLLVRYTQEELRSTL